MAGAAQPCARSTHYFTPEFFFWSSWRPWKKRETAKSGRRGVFLLFIVRVLADTAKTSLGAAVGFLAAFSLQSNIPTIRGADHSFFGVKPSDVNAALTLPAVACSHFGLPGGYRVFAYVVGVLVAAGCMPGFSLTRPGAFLARLRAVDEGEGEPT